MLNSVNKGAKVNSVNISLLLKKLRNKSYRTNYIEQMEGKKKQNDDRKRTIKNKTNILY